MTLILYAMKSRSVSYGNSVYWHGDVLIGKDREG